MADWRDPYNAAFADMGLSKWGTRNTGMSLNKWGTNTGSSIGSKWGLRDSPSLDQVMARYAPPPPDPFDPNQGQFAADGSMGSPSGGNWPNVNRWDSYVQQASRATGVPANVIKAVMMIESQGVLDAMSPQTDYGRYFGLMQIGPTSSVPEYMKSQAWLRGNPYNQILAGATELKNKYAAIGASNWTQAAGAYFGYGTDVTGTTTQGYMGAFNNYMNQLGSSTVGGGMSGAVNPSVASSNQVIQFVSKQIGVTPYVWGGEALNGWDCSGLIWYLNQRFGGYSSLPRTSHAQYLWSIQNGQSFTDMSQLQPGDVVFLRTGTMAGNPNAASHVGIYAGNGMMIHAANPSAGTIISPLSGYSGRIAGAMHMPWSGGVGGGVPGASYGQPQTQRQSIVNQWFVGN